MKESFLESSLSEKEITGEVIENKLLSRFHYLNDKDQLHNLYCSYDFRPEEESMVKVWDEILKYLFLNIFSTFGMKISEIKKYTIIKNHIPIGLMNIIQELRIRQKLITDSDICNQEFYNKNFPEIFSNNDSSSQGWGSYFVSGIKKLVNFGGNKLGCVENNDKEEMKLERRADISDDYKEIALPESTIVFNYELLRNNSQEILSFLSNILQENDNDVISKNEFIKEVNKVSSNNNGGLYNGMNLHFGSIYIDYCLIYLMKIKKISIFTIDDNNKNIEFIKLMINKNDTPKERDKVIAKLLLKCDALQLKIKDLENKIETCINNAKNMLKKGDKNSAKSWMVRKNNYLKYKQVFDNTHITLIQQMIDIKNAESNVKVTEILKSCNNILKNIGADRDEFLEISDDLREQKDFQNEISSGIKEFAGDTEDIDKELEQLENENNDGNGGGQNLEFPSALNQPLNPFSFESQQLYNQNK